MDVEFAAVPVTLKTQLILSLTKFSHHERESTTFLDFEFYAADSRFQVIYSSLCHWNLDSGFHLLVGFRIP